MERMPFRKLLFSFLLCGFLPLSGARADTQLSRYLHIFADFPSAGLNQVPCLPTSNDRFDQSAEGFAARTRTNDLYGMPGWTRSQGTRFHKGVDILPVSFEKTTQTVKIQYYDPKTRKNFSRKEPVLIPKDEIYSILDGVVVVANSDESRSGYGRYIMIEHRFANREPFISMYAHLDKLKVKEGEQVKLGDHIAYMGRTSSNPGGRTYLKAIPHCHFEIGRVINRNFPSTSLAKGLFPQMLGRQFDPRNIQPYNPLEFLQHFKARPRALVLAEHTTTEAPTETVEAPQSDAAEAGGQSVEPFGTKLRSR
jgi:hypothetical protein